MHQSFFCTVYREMWKTFFFCQVESCNLLLLLPIFSNYYEVLLKTLLKMFKTFVGAGKLSTGAESPDMPKIDEWRE